MPVDLMMAADSAPRLIQAHESPILRVEISSDNQRLVSLSQNGTLKIWNIETGQQVGAALTDQEVRNLTLCGGNIIPSPTLAMAPNGGFLASADVDGEISIVDLVSGKLVSSSTSDYDGGVRSLAFSSEGAFLFSGGSSGEVSVWDVQTGVRISTYVTGRDRGPVYMLVSPDGQQVLAAEKDQMSVYGLSQESGTFAPKGDPIPKCLAVLGVEFKTAAVFQKDYTLQFWDLDTIEPLGPPTEDPVVGGLANIFRDFERNWLATIDVKGRVTVWNLRTGAGKIMENPGSSVPVTHVGFSKSGSSMTTHQVNDQFLFWNPETGEMVWDPAMVFPELIEAIREDPSETLWVFVSESGRMYLWDVASKRQIGSPLTGHTSHLPMILFSPGSDRMLTLARDSAFLWNLDSASWPELACGRANRNMTEEEWLQYFGDAPYRKTCPDLP